MHPKTPRSLRARASLVAGLLTALLVSLAPASSAQVPLPELALWEANMLTYGQMHCYLGSLDHVYYDAQRVYYQIADYTGDPAWATCAPFARAVYRDQYVLPNNGSVPGYWNFTNGLRMDFERTGDTKSKDAVILLSQNAAYAHERPLEWTQSADLSREVAYAILSYINAEALGEPKRQRRIDLVNQAYDHMDQWFVRFAWPGPWQQSPQETYRLSPFMVALTAHTLIRDWEETKDSRLIPALRRAADWLSANAWIVSHESMWYESLDRSAGAPDLNLLIAPMYAFLYRQTGETKYRDQGDALFAGGVRRAYLAGGKQFDQNYWWSFDYVKWRSGPADTSPPVVSFTAPANGATVSGSAVTVSAVATDDVGVTRVQFTLNGMNLGPELTTPPYSVTWNTTTVSNGSYVLAAKAYDAAGNVGSAAVPVTVANPDVTPPTVAIVSPGSGQTVSGLVTVTAIGSDNVSVTRVDYLLDGQLLAVFFPPTYSYGWDTTKATNGLRTLSVRAYDAAGNVGSASVTVTVSNDTTPPTVSITAPTAGSTVAGVVTVSASATDNVAVAGVQFKLDGANLGAELTVVPYSLSWDTRTTANGLHTFTAVARDTSGNSAVSAAVTVTVANDTTPPAISSVSASNVSNPSATITWTTDEASDSQVEYGPTTAYGSVTPLDTTLVTAHSQVLSGLSAGTVYHYRVRSKDATGNLATSADFTFTPPPAGLVASWALDEGAGPTASDASGNGLTGALVNGPTWSAGLSGPALAFDGLSQYVNVPHAAALNAYPLTVAVWMKTTSTTGVRGLINKYAAGSFNGWNLFLNDGRLCAWYLRDSANYVYPGGGCPFSVPGYNDGRWHHVVFVVDAAGGRLFVDGILQGSEPWTGTPGVPTTTQPLHLAHYPGAYGGAEYFPGLLDEARVYNRALSPEEIRQLASVGLGLVSYWALDEGAGPTASDASGNGLTGALVNGPTWSAGLSGPALAFDGLSQYVNVPHAPALNAYPFTVAVWMKTTFTTGVRGLINKYAAGSFNGWNLFLNDGRLCAWYLRDSANYVYPGGGCPFSVPGYNDGRWHHVVFVVDAAGGRLFVDGILQGSEPWTGTPGVPTTTQPLHLAHYPGAYGGAEYFPGLLDEARVYNRALSPEEMWDLYIAGLW